MIDITTDTLNFNLYNELVRLNATTAQSIRVTVHPSVVVGSSSVNTPAFTTKNIHPDALVILINNEYIVGAGGSGSSSTYAYNGPAEAGGTALDITVTTHIINENIIGGGGGAGFTGGALGKAYVSHTNDISYYYANNGTPGSLLTGGSGSSHSSYGSAGDGGDLGKPGRTPTVVYAPSGYSRGPAGLAGYSIVGSGKVTFIKYGTILGPMA